MKATRPFSWAMLLLAAIFLASCVDDDQTNIKPEHKLIADPAPISSNGDVKRFAENNARHKIVMGVFDTGVDYNHPFLQDHMHFELDAKGVPIAAGRDFLGLDNWSAPRIIATSAYEFEYLSPRQKKRALDQYKTIENFNNTVRRQRLGQVCASEAMLKQDPRLERFMHPYRNLMTEASELRHGTHVAGLMTYDNPALGIIPYRGLPYHETEQEEADAVAGKADRFVKNFETALQHARSQGVRIINLSLGGSFEKPNKNDNARYEQELEKYTNYKRMLTDEMTKLVRSYPEILFVAAAGNDSGWSDNESRLQYPCGIEAPNMLCVGALDADGSLANFTNFPLNHVNIVMTSGVQVISTIPSDNCPYMRKAFDQFLSGDSGLCKYSIKDKKWKPNEEILEQYKSLINTFYPTCTAPKSYFTKMSGTSMATPIVSRMAAEIMLDPKFNTPEKVVDELKHRAKESNKLQVKTYELAFKQPSWYSLFKTNTNDMNEEGVPSASALPKAWFSLLKLAQLAQGQHVNVSQLGSGPRGWFKFLMTE